MDTKSLGPVIRELRIDSNWSQKGLADEAGLSRKVVMTFEKGTRKFSEKELVRICRVLKMPPEQVIQIWLRKFLEAIRKVERELDGEASPVPSPPPPESPLPPSDPEPEPGLGAKVEQALDQYYFHAQISDRKHFQEVLLVLQEDTLRKVAVMIAQSPHPPAPSSSGRPRSRVSRKGRVKPRG
jgi:transcriptional regulator with XRE-family HTH domain